MNLKSGDVELIPIEEESKVVCFSVVSQNWSLVYIKTMWPHLLAGKGKLCRNSDWNWKEREREREKGRWKGILNRRERCCHEQNVEKKDYTNKQLIEKEAKERQREYVRGITQESKRGKKKRVKGS